MKRVIGVTTLAAGAVLVIGGCGTTHASSGASGSSASSSVAARQSAVTPKQRATTDAASILASFVPPSGAQRLSGAAAAGPAGSALQAPVTTPESLSNVVDQVSWWQVPGSPQTVLAWEKAHLAGRFTAAGITTAGNPPSRWVDQFSLAPVSGVLTTRQLDVQAVSAGSGKTDLRVDAQVQWVPAKPAAEQVPSSATAVTISARSGPVAGGKTPGPVTITNPATVRRLAALVNGLALEPQGLMHCPVSMDRAVQLTFRNGASGPVAATVTAGLSGCQGVLFYSDGKAQPPLAGGGTVARQVLSVAGLHWEGYTPGGPVLNPGGTGQSSAVNPGGTMQQGSS